MLNKKTITITAVGDEAVRKLRESGVTLHDHGAVRELVTHYQLVATVSDAEVKQLRSAGFNVTIRRGAATGRKPRASKKKGADSARCKAVGYLTVDQVEAALVTATSGPFSQIAQLIALPEPTWEGRRCHAVKLSTGNGAGRVALYLLGGVHGCELGSSDILVNFIDRLERAYLEGTGVTFPNLTFTAEDIQAIFGLLDILVFPQANPDGRHYSMCQPNPGWRKNRRTEAPNSAAEPGVDLNRNFDFLWDFTQRFANPHEVNTSTRPRGDHYRGPCPFSEPESRNIRWLFESQPNVRYFVDLHSYGRHILHSWGDDDIQSTDPDMTFLNPAYDDKRGIENDGCYGEYMPARDLGVAQSLANCMKDAIQAVRGSCYEVASTFSFGTVSGTCDDYFYSRHFVDPKIPKVISQVIEWGGATQPPYAEMREIIEEISAALFALCVRITRL